MPFKMYSRSRPNNCDDDFVKNTITKINTNIHDFDIFTDENETIQTKVISPYITEKQLASTFLNNGINTFSLLHVNIRSMNKNFESLNNLLDQSNFNFSVLGLSETWFSDKPNSLFSIPGFDLVYNNRINKTGGGVGMYISSAYRYSERPNLNYMNDSIETIFVEIESVERKNIIIGVVYRPPKSSQNEFLSQLQNILANPLLRDKDCILMGDFNINLLNYDNDTFVQEFYGTLLTSSFMPLIYKPTRIMDKSSTLIDNIFTNIHPFPKAGVVISDLTDHFPIFASFQSNYRSQKILSINEYFLTKI